MFESKKRAVIFTQYEHQKIAGTLAQHWGNEQFAKPELPFDAFVAGVALHDVGYGTVDTFSIGNLSTADRLLAYDKLLSISFSDKVAEAVAKYHIARLMSHGNYPVHEKQCADDLALLRHETGFSDAQYKRADSITNLCDMVSFDFCFELPIEDQIQVYAKNTPASLTPITYAINEQTITLDPWPLSVPQLTNSIVAFEADTYPDQLRPILVPYTIRPKATL